MAKKTFKIGEYCKGGIISVETTKTQVTIIGKDWDFSAGSTKSSDQSKAQEFTRETVNVSDSNANRKILDILCDLTTSYYADKIMEFIEKNVTFKNFIW